MGGACRKPLQTCFIRTSCVKQARQDVPQDTLLTIYNAVVKPLFDYCDAVWGNLNKTLTARLQKLQNRAARIRPRKGHDVGSADIRKGLETNRKKTLSWQASRIKL